MKTGFTILAIAFFLIVLTTIQGCTSVSAIDLQLLDSQKPPKAGIASPNASAIAIQAGSNHTCLQTNAGGIKCWGWNIDGQIGDGSTIDRYTPVDVVGFLSAGLAVNYPTRQPGSFTFLVDTSLGNPGRYFVTASVNPSVTTQFILDPLEPLRPQEGAGPNLVVPSGLAYSNFNHLPIVIK